MISREEIVVRSPVDVGIRYRVGKALVTARRLARRQPLGVAGLIVFIITALMALFPWQLSQYSPVTIEGVNRLMAPSWNNWMGTDHLGRDVYSRIVHGTRISMMVSFASIAVGCTSGYLLGITTGFLGGKTDLLVQRVIDAMLAFPGILLALILVSALGPGVDKVIVAIAVGQAPRAARVSRGVVLTVKQNTYVDAARVVGASQLRIMLRHIVPNAMAPFLILASVGLGAAILIEASLSYLGLGVPAPAPSWGRMLSSAATIYAEIAPWMMFFPGIAITVLVLAFNLFGDSVRDVLDPRLRGR